MIASFDTFEISAIREGDAWKICDFMVANADYLKLYFPKSLEQNLNPNLSQRFVEQKLAQFQSKEEFVFTLKHSQTRELMGLFYIKALEWNQMQGEFAYGIGYPFQGKGLASKTITALSDYAFKTLTLETLQIITHRTNLASVGVAKKCGFAWIKTLKNEFTPTGQQPIDMELYELNRTF